MKKLVVSGGALLPFLAMAEGEGSDPLTGSNGLFTSLQTSITDTVSAVWPIISVVAGIGLAIWLGYTFWGTITKFFRKAKG